MYKLKEIGNILGVSDRTVERYLKSYFSLEKGGYQVSEKMVDILKDEYLESDNDNIVEEFTKDEYEEFKKRLIEYDILKDQLEYHRKSSESHNKQMEVILRIMEQRNYIEVKDKRLNSND